MRRVGEDDGMEGSELWHGSKHVGGGGLMHRRARALKGSTEGHASRRHPFLPLELTVCCQ